MYYTRGTLGSVERLFVPPPRFGYSFLPLPPPTCCHAAYSRPYFPIVSIRAQLYERDPGLVSLRRYPGALVQVRPDPRRALLWAVPDCASEKCLLVGIRICGGYEHKKPSLKSHLIFCIAMSAHWTSHVSVHPNRLRASTSLAGAEISMGSKYSESAWKFLVAILPLLRLVESKFPLVERGWCSPPAPLGRWATVSPFPRMRGGLENTGSGRVLLSTP